MSETSAGDGVLIVEDDIDIRELLGQMLERRGHRVTVAGDGRAALRMLREGGLRPCVILLDLMMPIMDGRSFRAAQLSDPALAAIPVVVMSAYRDAAANVSDLAPAHVFEKPLDVPRLLRVLKDLC